MKRIKEQKLLNKQTNKLTITKKKERNQQAQLNRN
jgi:hypothetical protein